MRIGEKCEFMYLWGKGPVADREEFVIAARCFPSETTDLEMVGRKNLSYA